MDRRPMFWVETADGGIRPSSEGEFLAYYVDDPLRRIAYDEDPSKSVRVSTVFLGIDYNHNPDPNAHPVLYESMLFGREGDEVQIRYYTREQALAGHAELCRQYLDREPIAD